MSRTKAENELIGRDRLCAGLCGSIDCWSFGGANLLKAIDDAGEKIVFAGMDRLVDGAVITPQVLSADSVLKVMPL